ncbi:tetratricopeptide repeat protein 12 [Cynoglossus semilaevis]|uniref:Tetratricopeptide repeat domain 12 n=1 Tax=Cynoglossus semilaevis TaxID=244447 RepID=A0A3P8WHI7_CYNSE|nr:tetratricopeptide repeat protein 12 [Cynoglossus semilaevis]
MSSTGKFQEMEKFLKSVDEISELLMNLNSSDAEIRQKAMMQAESHTAASEEPCRTKVNSTAINTRSSLQLSTTLQNKSPEGFMRMLERDAEDRRQRRTAREQKALAFKEKGNEAYAQEDYDSAVKYYSHGLAELRDVQQLYTNRAQAYFKLRKYREVIIDCEWALKCNERCTKAYLHMGRAYLELKEYNESRRCFEKILEIEPRRKEMVTEYLTQVDLTQERETQEINARQELDSGEGQGTAVPQWLQMLSRPGQTPLSFHGGLQILSEAVADCTGRTLFRLHNGFSIISKNDTVRSCLLQKTKDQISQELCVSVLKLWRIACNKNDENQRMLLEIPLTREAVDGLVASQHVATRTQCLLLLHMITQTTRGRSLVIKNLNVHMLVRNLMVCISEQQQNMAADILKNLAAENKFCCQLRDVPKDVIKEPLTAILRKITKSNCHVIAPVISIIGRLAEDDIIRHNLANDSECWTSLAIAVTQCRADEFKHILYCILGLMVDLSTVTSPVLQEHAVSVCHCCQDLPKDTDGGVITRAAGVLSNVLPQSPQAVQHVVQQGVVRTMCWLLKGQGQPATKYAIKTLTVCTAASQSAREELVKSDKKLSVLRHLLGSASDDEVVTGNAALCLTHCLQLDGVACRLLDTDVVLLLLRHAAGNAKKTGVQRNAAIALGALCRSEPRHVDKLRELHGFEVLHSCMKLIPST